MTAESTFPSPADRHRNSRLPRLLTEPTTLSRRPPITTDYSSESAGSINTSSSSLLKTLPHKTSPSRTRSATQLRLEAESSIAGTLAKQCDTRTWLYECGPDDDDDWLHVPGVERRRNYGSYFKISLRGVFNLGSLVILVSSLLMLFAGYPILYHFLSSNKDHKSSSFFGLGGTNGSGQVPALPLFSLIDADTPTASRRWTNPLDNSSYHLVFSDEFEVSGRSFWPGDDPFWQAVDLNYWVTGDFEWYSPEAVNTSHGFLNIWLTEHPTHNLNFQSGMLQSWNKFCFQGGYIETSVILPGSHTMQGFWPAIWLLGNLGRAGYAGTTQGMWPYSYTTCDVGTMPNQTYANKTAPEAAVNAHGLYSKNYDHKISFLEGQRCSACTCSGEDHPGPNVGVGRSSPEIDVFETQVNAGHGGASQSFQIAPFDANYTWDQSPSSATLWSTDTQFNSYTGGVYQEAVSGVHPIPDTAYALSGGTPVKMGVQYDPDWNGDGGGSITWFVNGQATWTLQGASLRPNPATEIGQRIIPTEPMALVINLALSDGYQKIQWADIEFPAAMKVDYIRVYQRDGQEDRISCDPADHPTAKYIQDHIDVYENQNLVCNV
ncbi:putative Beta-glucan synthesis-associated protein KRE6 (putative) [Pseudozyma hubeiensis]|nr:putative Beta-glucan synthesis-associated protein KRE6 (putative) [Pseudozyma hubeiensis]